MASVAETVWRLHCAGWTVGEINDALGIRHAREDIVRSWSLDQKRPSTMEMALALKLAASMIEKEGEE